MLKIQVNLDILYVQVFASNYESNYEYDYKIPPITTCSAS